MIRPLTIPGARTAAARVAHLAARLPVGGMETVVANLVRHTPVDQFQSEIWCLEQLDRLGEELRASGLTVRALGKNGRYDLGLFVRTAWMLHRHRIRILHCHDELSWFYGTLAARMVPRVRVVVTLHGRRNDIAPRHMREQRQLARMTAAIVCVSESLRDRVIEELDLRPIRVVTLPNGIEHAASEPDEEQCRRARAILGINGDHSVVGSVCELSRVKNLGLAIDAIALMRRSLPNVKLVLVGEGAERSHLESKIAAMQLEHCVTLTGLRRDVPEILPAFDAYVCSSLYEGVSLSILEAMSLGRVIVATAVGGNPEILRHGACGVLVPSQDPQRMAAALEHVLQDPVQRLRLGREAARHVRARHSIRSMIQDYTHLYSGLVGSSDGQLPSGVPWRQEKSF